jgi:hypothetical protein
MSHFRSSGRRTSATPSRSSSSMCGLITMGWCALTSVQQGNLWVLRGTVPSSRWPGPALALARIVRFHGDAIPNSVMKRGFIGCASIGVSSDWGIPCARILNWLSMGFRACGATSPRWMCSRRTQIDRQQNLRGLLHWT